MNISVVFENKNLLIINKPAGLIVHSDGKTKEPSVVDWIYNYYSEIRGIGENMRIEYKGEIIEIERPGIVHRIDRDTSGVLVIAKTQESFIYLKQCFKDCKIEKTYQALVYGHVRDNSGFITQPIGRHHKDFRMKMAGKRARGILREAFTEYCVMSRYEDRTKKDKQRKYQKYTFVECMPKTGRTHQIRVHFKWLNHPIVADSLYRGKRKETLLLQRTALHAKKICFIDSDGNLINVSIPLAVDIQEALAKLYLV